MSVERCIRQLIQPAREMDELAVPAHPAYGRGGDTGGREFGRTHDSPLPEDVAGQIALGTGSRH